MINQLRYDAIRNLKPAAITINARLCLFYGNNGAGKTSVLEAIHLLGTGRSFRTHQISQVINNEAKSLNSFCQLSHGDKIGVSRSRQNDYEIRINQESKQRLSILAEYLPIRVMTPESFLLLTSGAQARRQFLDFCVFHVEHSFANDWQQYNRLIKQRNALLKQGESYEAFLYWDNQIIPLVEKITTIRESTFQQIIPYFNHYQNRFLPQYKVQYSLVKGLSETDTKKQYQDSFDTDRRYGFTTIGPHKADIRVTIDNDSAHQVLSRGELKMLVASLILGQVKWLVDRGTDNYLLLDDLASELDKQKQTLVLNEINKLTGLQTFVTAIEKPEFFRELSQDDYQMFHVEHGVLEEK